MSRIALHFHCLHLLPILATNDLLRDMWLSRVKYAHQLSDQNWRYSALKYVGFNPADQFTFS